MPSIILGAADVSEPNLKATKSAITCKTEQVCRSWVLRIFYGSQLSLTWQQSTTTGSLTLLSHIFFQVALGQDSSLLLMKMDSPRLMDK